MGNAANADRDVLAVPLEKILPADDDTERGGKVNSVVTSM